MDFGRAFTYVFEDKEWLGKLVIIIILVMASVIPIFGLLAVAALLGYVTEITKNVRNGHPRPLPKWVDYGGKISKGGYVLLAMFIYNLPLTFFTVVLYTFSSILGESLFGSLGYVVIVCCALPIMFLYTVIAWSMLAVGVVRFSETNDNGVFYRFSKLFRTLQYNTSLTGQWVFYSIASNIVLSLISLIPCIGWIIVPALIYPVQGYLLGQYGRMLGASETAYRSGRA